MKGNVGYVISYRLHVYYSTPVQMIYIFCECVCCVCVCVCACVRASMCVRASVYACVCVCVCACVCVCVSACLRACMRMKDIDASNSFVMGREECNYCGILFLFALC